MLEQMEFDFSEKKPEPEKVATFLVELTSGWDGDTIRELKVNGTRANAGEALKALALADPKCASHYRDTWTVTVVDKPGSRKHTVCDFGSWTYFGRITRV